MPYPTKQLSEVWIITTWNTPPKKNKEYWWWDTLFVKPPHLWTWKVVLQTEETLSELWKEKGKIIKKNSIMVCCIGSLWKIWIAWEDLCTNQQINSITFDEKLVDFKYWYYYCTTLEKTMNKMANQAVVAIINKTNFSKIQIPIPPLPTQKLIVQKLDLAFKKLDKSINLTQKNLQNIEELNKSVLEEVFKKWEFEERKLGEICEFWPKKSEVKDLDENLKVSFVPMKDIKEKQKYFKTQEIKTIKEVYKWYTYFRNDDVLLAKVTPCFENWKSWIAKDLENWIWFWSSEYYVFRSKKNIILKEYLYYWITTNDFLKNWSKNMSWAVWLKRVTKDFVLNFKIPLPPLQKQKEIVEYLDNIFGKNKILKEKLEKNLANLQEMKQSLLKEAFENEDFVR